MIISFVIHFVLHVDLHPPPIVYNDLCCHDREG